VDDIGDLSAIGNLALDTLGDEFLGFENVFLEIAVPAAFAHRPERAHAAVYLVASALVQYRFTRTFVRSGKEASHHDGVGACRKGFDHIAAVLDAAVGHQGNAFFPANF